MYYESVPTNPKELRNIEEGQTENGGTKLDYIEVDDFYIQNSPNIFREGDIKAIPSITLQPKDNRRKFPVRY